MSQFNAQFGACANSLRPILRNDLPPDVAKVYLKTAARILTVASGISAAHLDVEDLVQNFAKKIDIISDEAQNTYLPLRCSPSTAEDVTLQPTSKLFLSSTHESASGSSTVALTTDESHCVIKTWCLR